MNYIASIIIALLLFFVQLPKATYAQADGQAAAGTASWKWPGPGDFYDAIAPDTTDTNLESTAFVLDKAFSYSFACTAIGLCSDNPEELQAYIRSSAVGRLNDAVALTFMTKPADTGVWLADVGQTLGFVPKQAYAQGLGFSGLMPLLPVWKAFRNVAYLLMAVVMIAIGFMVMFRKKIDPKTVVTAQNAIPRVIIALILITFSYAIVGVMIDLMYLLMFFAIALFKSTGYLPDPDPSSLISTALNHTTAESLYGQGGLLANLGNIEINPYKLLFGSDVNPGEMTGTLFTIGGILAALAFSVGGPVAAAPFGVLALGIPVLYVILALAIIYLFLRLAAFFLTAYIQILLSLIMAPVQLLFEAVPGSNAFSSWIKNLAANLAVFPVAAVMFMLSAVFTHFTTLPEGAGTIWHPPYANWFVTNMTTVSALVAFGILFAIPQVAGSVKEALKAKPVAPVLDFGGAGGSVMNMLSMGYYFKMLVPKFGPSAPGGDSHGPKK